MLYTHTVEFYSVFKKGVFAEKWVGTEAYYVNRNKLDSKHKCHVFSNIWLEAGVGGREDDLTQEGHIWAVKEEERRVWESVRERVTR